MAPLPHSKATMEPVATSAPRMFIATWLLGILAILLRFLEAILRRSTFREQPVQLRRSLAIGLCSAWQSLGSSGSRGVAPESRRNAEIQSSPLPVCELA